MLTRYWDYILSTRAAALEKVRLMRRDLDIRMYQIAYAESLQAMEKAKLEAAAAAANSLLQEFEESSSTSGGGASSKKKNKKKKNSTAAFSVTSTDESSATAITTNKGSTLSEGGGEIVKNSAATGEGGKGLLPSPPAPVQPSLLEYHIRGRGYVCRGLFRMLFIAGELGLIDKRENRFMSWKQKFSLRFRMFEVIQSPTMLRHEDFLSTIENASKSQLQQRNNSNAAQPAQQVPPASQQIQQKLLNNPKLSSSEAAAIAARIEQEEAAQQQIVNLTDVISGAESCYKIAKKLLDDARKSNIVLMAQAESRRLNKKNMNANMALPTPPTATPIPTATTAAVIPSSGPSSAVAATTAMPSMMSTTALAVEATLEVPFFDIDYSNKETIAYIKVGSFFLYYFKWLSYYSRNILIIENN